ncbi:MAG: V4R domain-containing protein [Methanocaldococcus sp.]
MEKIFPNILEAIKNEEIIKNSKKIPMPYFGLFALVVFDKVKELSSETSLYEIGEDFGKLLSPKNIEELKKIFKLMDFGDLEIDEKEKPPQKIKLSNPPYKWVSKDEPIHDFIAGILAGCLEEIFKKKFIVNEIECVCQGKDKCVFEVIETNNLNK